MSPRRPKHVMWIAGALLVIGLGLYASFRWMRDRPLFEPGTVREQLAKRGESLEAPRPADGASWQVTPRVALAHDSFGRGAEHVLFVHGGPGFPPGTRPRALELVADRAVVHTYHQRGCGRSTRPFERAPAGSFYEQLVRVEAELGLAEQIADIERIRRILGQERLVIVGHSFGALVAALYAAELPESVARLVLVSPAPLHVMPNDPDLFADVGARLGPADRAAYDDYLRGYFDLPSSIRLEERELSRFYGRFREFYARATSQPAPPNDGDVGGFAVLATYASLGRRHDWRPALGRIRAPTIVVHGRNDLVSEEQIRGFAQAIPGARVTVVEAGHFGLDDAAPVLRDLILP